MDRGAGPPTRTASVRQLPTNFGNYVNFNQAGAAELAKIGINLTVKVLPVGA